MDIVGQFICYGALKVEDRTTLHPDFVHVARSKSIVIVVAMDSCVSEPPDFLSSEPTRDRVHFILNVHLYSSNKGEE